MTLPRITLRDAAVVLALLAAMAAEALWFPYHDAPLTWASLVLVVGTALPALVRRTHPGIALAASAAILLPATDLCPVIHTGPFAAMLAGYWLARTRGTRVAVTAGILLVPWVVFLMSRGGVDKLLTLDLPKNLAFIALPIVLGLAARYRSQSVQALVERAEEAERGREQEALRRVGEERLRIARDVHDVVSHSMVAIIVQAGVGSHLMDTDPATARQTLLDIRRISAETLTDLRGILGLLREEDGEAAVEPTTTLAGLADLASTLQATGLELDLQVDVGDEPLSTAVDVTAYRIVQEALTNVLRHAPGSATRVRIVRIRDTLSVEVEDQGGQASGAVPDGTGNGLRGLRERVRAIGGQLDAGPRPEGGWLVRARLPIAASVHHAPALAQERA